MNISSLRVSGLWLLLMGIALSAEAITPNAVEQELANLILTDPAQQRAALVYDPILNAVARARAEDMAARAYFSHVDPDGVGPNRKAFEAGYFLPPTYPQAIDANNIESIAAGQTGAAEAFVSWMSSPGHRTHIMGESTFFREQTRFGIGFADVPGSPFQRYYVFLSAPPNLNPNPPNVSGQAQFVNLSTRAMVLTNDNALIGGCIIQGQTVKRVAFLAKGPSLTAFGVQGALADPIIDIFDSEGNLLAQNDNWRVGSSTAAIEAAGLALADSRESAVVLDLPPGGYTAIVRGVGLSTGVGLVEIFDLNPEVNARLVNISTRAPVLTGDQVMIGGFISEGDSPRRVLIRALGPSLIDRGVPNVLQDPVLRLMDANGNEIAFNNNWEDDQSAMEIGSLGLAPLNPFECAMIRTLPPGAFTAIVSGANNGIGNALIEVFQLD